MAEDASARPWYQPGWALAAGCFTLALLSADVGYRLPLRDWIKASGDLAVDLVRRFACVSEID